MKYCVPVLRILLVIGFYKALDWFFDSNFPPTPPFLLVLFAIFGLFGAAQIFVGVFEPNDTVPCPHCGFGNIQERRICKRCRGSLPPAQKLQPEDPRPMLQHWVDVEIGETDGRRS